MSDKAAFQGSFNPPSESGADRSATFASPSAAHGGAQGDGSYGDVASAQTQAVYGPAPKPVKQPAIFDRIYDTSSRKPIAQAGTPGSPFFSISAQRIASNPVVNTVSSQTENHGEHSPISSSTHGMELNSAEPNLASDEQPSVNSAQNHGFPASGPDVGGPDVGGSDVGASDDLSPEGATTIAVESQCDSPSLNDIVDTDISQASREELMVYHSELMGWIRELERALQDCQSDFKASLQQYAQQEQLVEERTQELVNLRERHAALNQEVDVQQKSHQRQTILVETLQEQLSGSQERVAQMERDFSQMQRRCSDQAQQLLQAEGLCRDLKSRLSRQQRHTMQFKAALEKSLAVSVNDSDYDLGDLDLDSMDSSGELFPRPKPVQPWSNQLDEAALNQALSGLEPPQVTKGNNLQLAFESTDEAEQKAAQSKAVSKAQMAYGSAAMGLAVSQTMATQGQAEPVFDPEQAEDLEASLKQESDSILQGDLLGGASSNGVGSTGLDNRLDNRPSHGSGHGPNPGQPVAQSPLGASHGVAFVPPITPVVPAEKDDSILTPSDPLQKPATLQDRHQDGGKSEPDVPQKRTTLAGIHLPSFPKF